MHMFLHCYSLVPKVLGKNLHTRRSCWICLDCCFLTAQCVGAESSWRKAEQHSWPRMMRWWCLESIPLIIASQNDQSMLETGRKSENIRTCWKINSLLLWWHYWKHHLHPPAPFENHPRNNGKPTKKNRGGDMVPVVDRNEVHCERSASRRDGVTPGKIFGRWKFLLEAHPIWNRRTKSCAFSQQWCGRIAWDNLKK